MEHKEVDLTMRGSPRVTHTNQIRLYYFYHHVHGHKKPDIDHLEVGGGGECGLDTGNDGGNHQHQSKAYHDPVLDNIM